MGDKIHISCHNCGFDGYTFEDEIEISSEQMDEDLVELEDELEHCPKCGVPIIMLDENDELNQIDFDEDDTPRSGRGGLRDFKI